MAYSKIIYKFYSVITTDYVFFLPILFILCCLVFNWLNVAIIFIAALPFYWRKLYIILITSRRDLSNIYRLWNLISYSKYYGKQNLTVWKLFQRQVASYPEKACFLYEDAVWTYQNVDDYSNKVANIFNDAGFKAGETVALMMNNRPEYVCIWLGLSKIGVVTALINPNLKGNSLSHCIDTAKSKAIIYHEEFSSVLNEVCNSSLEKYKFIEDIKAFNPDESTNGLMVLNELLIYASKEFPQCSHEFSFQDDLLYIYTSGTTGLPKAAIIRNSRYILAGIAAKHLCVLSDDDIVYNCLPLCHTSGGCLAVGLSLTNGITTVIKKKFSASKYFSDCDRYNTTVAMYIGEMCRYLLSNPNNKSKVKHKLKAMVGNGLRPALWTKFKETFDIPHIFEFYGATEGNVNVANMNNKVGAVGCIPNLIPASLYPIALIKVDMDTGLPLRNSFGLCIRCPPGEAGMLVGIIEQKDPTRNYAGYVNSSESKKKVIQDVFSFGDSAFASGDLLVIDELGFLYFKDRTGDTFRWKGENVSTCEVESVISCFTGLSDCIVYGVQVGDCEGRAGMASIVASAGTLDLSKFAMELDAQLAPYARPIFLRLVPSVVMTATFKLRKIELEKFGFDPSISPSDHQLFFRKGDTYAPLTKDIYDDIMSNVIRF